MQVIDYIKPELLVVSVVLFFMDKAIKQSGLVDLKYIPFINGIAGILICGIYVASACACSTRNELALGVFTAITQGVLVAGITTRASQYKKIEKQKEE